MKGATTAMQWIIRISGLVLIVLGVCFWLGRAVNLVPLHMLIGLVFVVALWTLAAIGLRAKVGTGLTVGAITWGAVVLVFGMVQRSLMPGDLHWVVQVVHLLAGLIAMGVAEKLAARIGAVAVQPVM
jgi:hypothetical protein